MTDSSKPYVLAFGDSLVAGYGLASADAFPARLQFLLREHDPGAIVQNAGVSGDTTASALARLPAVLSALTRKPDLVIVELGANDLIRRVPPQQTLGNLDAILRELRRCELPILLATVDPPAFLGALGAGYAAINATLAERYGIPTHPFFPPGVLGDHAHVLHDRLHPNAEAIRKVADAILPAVLKLLASHH